jgi:CBS domain-containing protein
MDKHAAFEFLKHVPIHEIVKHKGPVVEVKADTPIEQCLDLLRYARQLRMLSNFREKSITSFPVWSAKQQKYLGIVSIMDILIYVSFASYFKSGGQVNVSGMSCLRNFASLC